ncbi:hypothetical protein OOT33_11365 [Sphingobium sp. DEHP117]|uniref:hypothetical protein n=1 Tax=Sphingobium sp. DEHP117 TaxID=2993436 RepID=UPI0027D55858|nr:hypothetical protein [Sphingobium sp. DEHP117]MDQ4421025.1 hypothetical protein [Sphingobium sp. DEHP117]
MPLWFAAMLGLAGALGLIALLRREGMWALAAAFVAGNAGHLGLEDPLWFGALKLKPQGLAQFCYVLIALEAAAAGIALLSGGRLAALWQGAQRLGMRRILLLGLLLLICAVSPMGFVLRHEYTTFAKQVFASADLIAIHGVCLAALAMMAPEEVLRQMGAWGERVAVSPRLPYVAALWAFGVSLLLALTAFDRMPRLPDEVAYLFQAKMYAAGHLYLAAPGGALNAALAYDWISIESGKWFSIFPPAWPAVLALGVAAGAPFIVNPLLTGLAVLLSHSFVARIASTRLAALVTLLLCISPWFLAMGASLMSHPLTLVLVLGAWRLMLVEGRFSVAAWLLAGLLMGALFLTRPLEGVLIGTGTGLWAMSRADLRALSGWIGVAAYGAGCIALGALVFPYNRMLTGNAMATPIDQYFDHLWHKGANRLGFGADIGSPDSWGGVDIWRGHGPLEALIEQQFNLKSMNTELLGWAVGSLLLVYVHLIWGRLNRMDKAMLTVMGATILAYSLYWFNGGFYIGPRYWYMTLWPALYLSARGLQTAAAMTDHAGWAEGRQRVAVVAALMGALGLFAFLPWRAVEKYWEFRGFHSGYREMAAAGATDNALIFVKSDDVSEFGSAFTLNTPDLSGPVFVRDLGPAANAEIIARLPGRAVWHIAPRATGESTP